MSRLLLFNPETDLALAADESQYTPPRAALTLRHAGALLPLWWAKEDDYILVDTLSMAAQAEELKSRFNLHGTLVTSAPSGAAPHPWGWSRYTRSLFLRAGVDETLLPSDQSLAAMRTLSHRRTTIEIHRKLDTPQHLRPVEAHTLDYAEETIDRFGSAVIKLPWSSSGRGILYSAQIPRDTLRNYISGIIHRQGSALIEPHLQRINDFAALFQCEGSQAHFRGLSAFNTDNRGCYIGNIIAPQSHIARHIGIDLTDTISRLTSIISNIIAPFYSGWLGVDMLTYADSHGHTALAPCIEVNLRSTMGIAVLHISEKLPVSDTPRPLHITPAPPTAEAINLSPSGQKISIWC